MHRSLLVQFLRSVCTPITNQIRQLSVLATRAIPKKYLLKGTLSPIQNGHVPSSKSSRRRREMIQKVMKQLKNRSNGTGVVSRDEFLEVCAAVAGRLEGSRLANRFISQRLILRYRDRVYLNIRAIDRDLKNRLQPTKEEAENLLSQKQKRFEEMDNIKQRMDTLAHRNTQRAQLLVLNGLLFKWALYFRLTYEVLSWDFMEPIGYLTSYVSIIMVLFYYINTRRSGTYRSMFGSYRERESKKFYKMVAFNVSEYLKLKEEIEYIRKIYQCILNDGQ
eukprot:g2682.t1